MENFKLYIMRYIFLLLSEKNIKLSISEQHSPNGDNLVPITVSGSIVDSIDSAIHFTVATSVSVDVRERERSLFSV